MDMVAINFKVLQDENARLKDALERVMRLEWMVTERRRGERHAAFRLGEEILNDSI